MKKILLGFICFIVLTSLPIAAFAQSGKTDTSSVKTSRIAKSGWQNSGGKWYFYSSGKIQRGWVSYGNNWYYLDGNGVMKTGWVYQGQKWYYLTSSGAMAKGWVKDSGTWYYLQSSGAMKTGWLKDGSKWYYLKSNGAMKIGWELVSGQWYYLDSSGAMKTEWIKDSANWYYLNTNGVMAKGWLHLDYGTFFLESSGAMQTGWIKIGGDKYYFYPNGTMAHNTIIDDLHLGSDGKADTNIPEVYKITKSVANQFGYSVQYLSDPELIIIADGSQLIAGVEDGEVGGYSKYINFLSAVSSKIGAPETPQNMNNYFVQISNPNNPDYYERSDFGIYYNREMDWVRIRWGNILEINGK
jgi:glucan-binding YG repeat protein